MIMSLRKLPQLLQVMPRCLRKNEIRFSEKLCREVLDFVMASFNTFEHVDDSNLARGVRRKGQKHVIWI